MLTTKTWMNTYDLLLLNGELTGISQKAIDSYKVLADFACHASLSFEFISDISSVSTKDAEQGIKELTEKKIIIATDTAHGYSFYRLHKRLLTSYTEIEVT
jgi:hypothetical protein